MHADEQKIRELIATWMEATKANDLPRVLALMSEDVVFLTPGRPPMQGRAAYETAAKTMPVGVSFDGKSEVQEIRVAGDFAWCWTKLSVAVNMPGKPPSRRSGHTLSVLQKYPDGRWLLIRDANLLVSDPTV